MRTFICCDIETKANPAVAERLWKPPSRLVDPAKIAAAKVEFIEKAALSPLMGEIVVIGLVTDDAEISYLEGDERIILTAFWDIVGSNDHATTKFVYWSGSGAAGDNFDMDYIVTRSRILGVRIPGVVRNGRFYGQRFVDLASEFLLYKTGEYLSLSNAGMLFGLYDKAQEPAVKPKLATDEVQGANFAQWYGKDREKALGYLKNDLALLFHLAKAIL